MLFFHIYCERLSIADISCKIHGPVILCDWWCRGSERYHM